MKNVAEGMKEHVLTPAAKGAVQAVLQRFTAPASNRGGKALPIFTLIGIGVVIGAGAALLLSPATGKEVRAKLMGLVSKLKSKRQDEPAKVESDEAQTDAAKPESPIAGNSHSRRKGGTTIG